MHQAQIVFLSLNEEFVFRPCTKKTKKYGSKFDGIIDLVLHETVCTGLCSEMDPSSFSSLSAFRALGCKQNEKGEGRQMGRKRKEKEELPLISQVE